jgi:hypothetical protein
VRRRRDFDFPLYANSATVDSIIVASSVALRGVGILGSSHVCVNLELLDTTN